MAKESDDDKPDKGKDEAGLCGLVLAEVVMEIIEKADFFPALGQCNASKGIQGLQHQVQARKLSSLRLDVLDNLVSPFLLLAAAEKMYYSGADLTESCAGPLPMYEEVHSDLGTLLQLFQPHAKSAFVPLLQIAQIVVEIRIWLCRWYLLDDSSAGPLSAAPIEGPEAQAARQDPLSTLTAQMQRLQKCKSHWKGHLTDLLPWMEVVLVEGKTVDICLRALASLNRHPPDLLSVTVQLLRMRKAIGLWEDESVIQPPASERDVVIRAPRYQLLRQLFQHLINKMPLRFHAVADQVMPLSKYNTELLGLPSSSSSLSPHHSSSDSGSSNPYVALIARFLLSYGPAAKVCVSIFKQTSEGAAEKEVVNTSTNKNHRAPEEGHAYDLPCVRGSLTAPSQRQDILDRGFVPTFSMTSGKAAAASGSKQHSSARYVTVSSSSSALASEPPLGRLSSSSSSKVPGMGITTVGSELSGSFTSTSSSSSSARRDHGPPPWFWALCHHSGLWLAVEGRLPEGGAQRFSLSGARGEGGGKGQVSGPRASPLEGTFIHQSGKHHTFTYFVAHVSPEERLVVAFGDRICPANDKTVTSFLRTATSFLNDRIAHGV
ncbi:Hypothetical protein NocV09_00601440 [Nannochloropsis oceanica]